jgi:hypothetical protein
MMVNQITSRLVVAVVVVATHTLVLGTLSTLFRTYVTTQSPATSAVLLSTTCSVTGPADDTTRTSDGGDPKTLVLEAAADVALAFAWDGGLEFEAEE